MYIHIYIYIYNTMDAPARHPAQFLGLMQHPFWAVEAGAGGEDLGFRVLGVWGFRVSNFRPLGF